MPQQKDKTLSLTKLILQLKRYIVPKQTWNKDWQSLNQRLFYVEPDKNTHGTFSMANLNHKQKIIEIAGRIVSRANYCQKTCKNPKSEARKQKKVKHIENHKITGKDSYIESNWSWMNMREINLLIDLQRNLSSCRNSDYYVPPLFPWTLATFAYGCF